MLLDIIQPDNINNYNITLANTLGLSSAVYLNEILKILSKVKKKGKFDNNGFFKLDRTYVKSRTSLSYDEQIAIDKSLSNVNIIAVSPYDTNTIAVDISLIVNILASDDVELMDDLKEQLNLSLTKKKDKKASICTNLKNLVSTGYQSLDEALRDWVESVFSNKKINKLTVTSFIEDLMSYMSDSEGLFDEQKAIKIVNIATSNVYTHFSWASKIYEEDRRISKQKTIRVTRQHSSNSDISEEVI